jgi:hypothetical protein
MVIVTDVNDNAPVLTLVNPIQPILVEDDSAEGTFIAQFEATDNDTGSNADLSFSILEAQAPFQIDPADGIVTLQGTLDVNTQSRYTITVLVEDSGMQSNNDSYSLIVYAIEGQSVSFDAGQEGFLVGTYTKPSDALYEQPVGFLVGENIGTPVRLRGNVNLETVAEDVIQIPNFGGTPAYIRGALLQTSVAYSQKTVVAFVQAFDSRDVIAEPTPIRVRIFSNISSVPLERSCTTSPDFGYCFVSMTAPDSWFVPPATITGAYANFLNADDNGLFIGSADIISSPLLTHNFYSEQVLLIPPAHSVFPSRTFTAELYAISPYLYEAYNRIDFTVSATGATFTSVSSDNTWDCTKQDNNVVCLLGDLPLGSPLRITELSFIAADTAQIGSISLSIDLRFDENLIFQQSNIEEKFTVEEIRPLAYFAVARQPDIVNTLALSDSTVSRSLSLLTINSNVVEEPTAAVSPVTDRSRYGCGHDSLSTAVEVDCQEISLKPDSLSNSVDRVTVTVTSTTLGINPVHAMANRVAYYIWDVREVELQVTDSRLSRVAEWNQLLACLGEDQFQSARITASAVISSADNSFTATNVLPLIADKLVVSNEAVVGLDRESHTINARRVGESNITLDLSPGESLVTTVTVEDTAVGIHRLDPIVGTLRLSLDSVPKSRLGEGLASLQILRGVLFLQERAVVTASVVFKDGHRSLIQNPLELVVNSLNSSVVSVSEGNILVGESEGEAVIGVAWINPACGAEILSEEVTVRVIVDDSRPTFVPNELTAPVPEDSLGQIIHVVTAVLQDDSGRIDQTTSDIQYRFKDGFNFNGLFALDATSGELELNGRLDREDTDSYTLLIEATNGAQRRAEQGEEEEEVNNGSGDGDSSGSGGGLLIPGPSPDNANISLNIAVLTLRVEVTDVNDNPPVCVPQPDIQLDRTVVVGEPVGSLMVTDADEGMNAEIEFVEIKEGLQNEELLFSIGQDGTLTTSRSLPQGGSSALTVVVTVRDKGEPANTVECSLVVRLFDLQQIVDLTLANPYDEVVGKVDLLEAVLADILGDEVADLYVVRLVAINDTHTRAEVYAINPNNEFISAADLHSRIVSVMDDDTLIRFGVNIVSVDVASEEPEILEIPRKIPPWAIAVIIVLNSVIIILVLLLVLGVVWKRYSRLRERENQRRLNKRTGLRDFDSVADSMSDGERIETGGVVHPNRGALIYKKTTKVETVDEPDRGVGAQKKIKKVTSETSWIGKPERESDTSALVGQEEEAWHDDQVEQNPLYSTRDYVTDFSNPLYARRMSGVEGEEIELQSRSSRGSGKDGGRAARGRPSSPDTGGKEYVDYLSEQPDFEQADTLF